MLYDGRGYLRQAHLTFTGSPEDIKIIPSYSSEGLLMSRTEERHWSGDTPGPDGEDSLWLVHNNETTHLFYFAGRPVAQLTDGALFSITTDHLGNPVLITNAIGTPVWAGGLEPFGRPWTAGGNPDPEPLSESRNDKGLSRLSSESAFLRYPGQWASDAFRVGGVRMEVYYNVHRWYEVGVGRYRSPEPINWLEYSTHFIYVQNRPTISIDPRGLLPCSSMSKPSPGSCCKPGDAPLAPALRNIMTRRRLYCSNKVTPAIESDQQDKKGWIEIVDGEPFSHYKPQGNPCLDWCICAHEDYHIWQYISGELDKLGHNGAECKAYNEHLKCLLDLTREGPPITGK